MRYNYLTLNESLTGRNKMSRKLDNNTYAVRLSDGKIAIKLHNTHIVTFAPDGRISFTSGGWRTMTTKARITDYSPAQVSQLKGVWYIKMDGQEVPFADGITWTSEGWVGFGEDPAKADKLVKRIRQYVNKYMDAFAAGKVPKPDGGDCWLCLMRDAKTGRTLPGTDHLESHMQENYFVPSLLVAATKRFPVSLMAQDFIAAKWTTQPVPESFTRMLASSTGGFLRDQVQKSLYRFMKEQFGLAA